VGGFRLKKLSRGYYSGNERDGIFLNRIGGVTGHFNKVMFLLIKKKKQILKKAKDHKLKFAIRFELMRITQCRNMV